jgi:hypothetical protein
MSMAGSRGRLSPLPPMVRCRRRHPEACRRRPRTLVLQTPFLFYGWGAGVATGLIPNTAYGTTWMCAAPGGRNTAFVSSDRPVHAQQRVERVHLPRLLRHRRFPAQLRHHAASQPAARASSFSFTNLRYFARWSRALSPVSWRTAAPRGSA